MASASAIIITDIVIVIVIVIIIVIVIVIVIIVIVIIVIIIVTTVIVIMTVQTVQTVTAVRRIVIEFVVANVHTWIEISLWMSFPSYQRVRQVVSFAVDHVIARLVTCVQVQAAAPVAR